MSDNDLRKRYEEARGHWSEWRTRAEEDLRFSNPADPKQWDDRVKQARGLARPALVFDQTNQYIGQVVNDARQNRPAIDVLPGDSEASDKAADFYGGLIRQIEYASRAQIAYDTSIEYAARIGLGFLLVVPEMVDARTNDHDIRIKPVHDPLCATLDPESVEPDGQDADCGWLETRMAESAFKRRFPKAKPMKPGDRFVDQNGVLVCQYFERTYERANRIILQDGSEYGEDDYHEQRKQGAELADLHTTYLSSTPKVVWSWWNGEEILEETAYAAPYIGLVPVYGNVLWVDGKRQVCGMTRRMMDACRAYNYARSAEIEAASLQPKAPWVAPARAIAAYKSRWERSNVENTAVLPYDDIDSNDRTIPAPKRQDPPQIGAAFPLLSQAAKSDIEASVGMFKASLGQNSNAKSGRAISRLQTEADTATFHYIDNLSRSIEQVGRICVAMIPTYYDREKVARILKVDGKPQAVRINPSLPTAHAQGSDLMEVNPARGAYDVRVKTGPSYTSMRQEMADKLVEMGQSNPPLAAALSPLVLQMADMPGADKAINVALALLPPEVRSAYDEDNGAQPQIPPEIQGQMQQMDEMIQQLQGALEEASARVQELEADAIGKWNETLIKAFDAETKRIQAVSVSMSPEEVRALAMQTVLEALQPQPEPTPPGGMPMPGMHPGQMMNPQKPPPGGFFMPEQGQPFPPAMAATGAHPGPGAMPVLPEGNPQ
jgi:hypothetical protein